MKYKNEAEALNDQTPGYEFKVVNGAIYRRSYLSDRWDFHTLTGKRIRELREENKHA